MKRCPLRQGHVHGYPDKLRLSNNKESKAAPDPTAREQANAAAPTRVFVIDDHPFFRSGVVSWLHQEPGVICCGEAESVSTGRRAIRESQPDVLLLDLQLKDGDGLSFTTELCQEYPSLRVVILSQFDEELFAHRALRAGARGYVMKAEATEKVLAAIQTVMRGELYISRTMSARLLQNLFPDPAATGGDLALLSDRELQVFQMVGAGCRNNEIAAALKISPKTVDTYRENLKQKLALRDADALHQAATRWVESGDLPALRPISNAASKAAKTRRQ